MSTVTRFDVELSIEYGGLVAQWSQREVRAPAPDIDMCYACGNLTTSTPAYCSAACRRAEFGRDVRLDKTDEREE